MLSSSYQNISVLFSVVRVPANSGWIYILGVIFFLSSIVPQNLFLFYCPCYITHYIIGFGPPLWWKIFSHSVCMCVGVFSSCAHDIEFEVTFKVK